MRQHQQLSENILYILYKGPLQKLNKGICLVSAQDCLSMN